MGKIFSNYEIIYLLLLIMNSGNDDNDNDNEDVFNGFFINFQKSLDDFYDSDVLLINHYNEDEIIYYIFINYIYDIYKTLLEKSTRDIKIIINNDSLRLKTVENYRKIYNTINSLLKNPNKEFINFLKKNLRINEDYKKTIDSKYLLTFIYKYSKLDIRYIKGYDSFLTYLYLNILYKFDNQIKINYKKYDNIIPSLDIYKFKDLEDKKFYFELTSKQQKMAEGLLNDKRLLLKILGERYYDYSQKRIIKNNTYFIITAEIFEYINSLNGDNIFDDYKSLSIIDYDIYKYEDYDDNETKEENIETNIIRYASYIYRDDVSVKNYSKLVKYYLLGIKRRLNTRILNFGYEMIYKMNNKINKDEIENNLIRELSKSNIELDIDDINKYKNPENKKYKIDILDILNRYYDKLTYDIIITYLSKLYKLDDNNKLQIKIQDLLYKKEIYGGSGSSIEDKSSIKSEKEISKFESTEKAVNILLNNDRINGLEKNIKKINDIIRKSDDAGQSEKLLSQSIYIFKPQGGIKHTDAYFNKYEDYDNTETFNRKQGILTTEALKIDEANNTFSTIQTILGQLKSKKSDIISVNKKIVELLNKFNDEMINEKWEKISNSSKGKYVKELNDLISPIKDLLENIKKTTELQEYPIIKEIYKIYIKYENREDNQDENYDLNAIKYIDNFIKYNKEIIENNLEKVKLLLSRYELMIEAFENILKSPKNNNNNRQNGGTNIIKKYMGGENNEDIKNKLDKLKSSDTLNNLLINLKKLKGNRDIKNNIEKRLAADNFIDKDGFNLFDKLMLNYNKDYNNKEIPHEITKNKFYNKVKNLNLDPEEELEITINDKIIFVVMIYIIRIISLYMCYNIIDNNYVTSIHNILVSYIIWYIIIFVGIVLIINIDTFKLRILVNYMNLHINSFNLLLHLILMGIFIYIIYLLIIKIDVGEAVKLELNDREKIKLKYKLDLLTIFIYIFICILIFII